MLSQNQIKHVAALRNKKFRDESGLFIAEGHKLVTDLAGSGFVIEAVYASAEWIVTNLDLTRARNIPVFETIPREMDRISALTTPSPVLAVVRIPAAGAEPSVPQGELVLALDDIRDPGNLGTIIRIADWFGISSIFCSESCVDTYNPKVVQATMGSIARVRVVTCDLPGLLAGLPVGVPVFGAFLQGETMYDAPLEDHGIILIGNESRGISQSLEPFVTGKIFIPSASPGDTGRAESLNASVATAVIVAEFRRRYPV